ncbi:MAG: hypothetical protein IPI09_11030 [Burkholderiales bacterium]|uniref:hypothetical protein n=1 Tax=Candidatus Aalborgicola defluviihabitans TaxID=3386187 RepID=UPI001D4BB7FB|nr:hypothetical protein [Burkholderiales bacterium]MBK7313903.1 hypothetical protein [Burkholderiales bacterium]MBL0245080.1 hypothetical protein [Rhodoferax sp.]
MIPKTLKLLALGAGAAVLAGCASSPIPVSANFPLTVEPKVRSAGHWGQVSNDVAKQTLESLSKLGVSGNLYVALPANPTAFDRAFNNFLITDLVKAGRVVQQSPDQALEVSYETQVVRHNSPRPNFLPGRFTMITAGLYAAYGLGLNPNVGDKMAGGLAAAVGADYIASESSGGPTATELILTTTIASGGRYLVRKTDVYYVEEADTTLLQYRYPQVIKVVGQ